MYTFAKLFTKYLTAYGNFFALNIDEEGNT